MFKTHHKAPKSAAIKKRAQKKHPSPAPHKTSVRRFEIAAESSRKGYQQNNKNNNNTTTNDTPKDVTHGFGNLLNRVKITPQEPSDVPPSSLPQEPETRDFLTSKEFKEAFLSDHEGIATRIRRTIGILKDPETGAKLTPFSAEEKAEAEAALRLGDDLRPQFLIQTRHTMSIINELLRDEQDLIAMDLEFSNNSGFAPTLELMQISTRYGYAAVIDFQKLSSTIEIRELIDILNTKKIILHGGDLDLTVLQQLEFQYDVPCIPVSAIDTQILAGMLNLSAMSIGLGKLCALYDLEVPKGLGASNWSVRPLDIKQIKYAFTDVKYLHLLETHLSSQLSTSPALRDCINNKKYTQTTPQNATDGADGVFNRKELTDLLIEEFTTKPRKKAKVDDSWKQLMTRADVNEFTPQQLDVLKALAKWRDITAYRGNKAPTTVLRNDVLIGLAKTQPTAAEIRSLYSNNFMLCANARVLGQLMEAVKDGLVKEVAVPNQEQEEDNAINKNKEGENQSEEEVEAMKLKQQQEELLDAELSALRLNSSQYQVVLNMCESVMHYAASENNISSFVVGTMQQVKHLVVCHQALVNGRMTQEQYEEKLAESPLMQGFRFELVGKHIAAILNGARLEVTTHKNVVKEMTITPVDMDTE